MSVTKGELFGFQCCAFLDTASVSYTDKQLLQKMYGDHQEYERFKCQTKALSAMLCTPGDLGQT